MVQIWIIACSYTPPNKGQSKNNIPIPIDPLAVNCKHRLEEVRLSEPAGLHPTDVVWRNTMLAVIANEDQIVRTSTCSDLISLQVEVEQRANQLVQLLLDTNAWPLEEKDTIEVIEDAWLLAQHADSNPSLQYRALEVMSRSPAIDPIIGTWIAYLEDRIAVNEFRLQRYGTQGDCIAPKAWVWAPLEDSSMVDEYRAQVGLEPLESYAHHMSSYCK